MAADSIVWQAQCAQCGWKDPDVSRDLAADLAAVQARAAAHLQAAHGLAPGPRPGGVAGADIRVPVSLAPDWQPGQCMCLWREDLSCPNPATWRVENTTNEGFCEMCTPHKEGFAALEPQALVRYLPLGEADA